MRYASVFLTILIVWMAIVTIAALAGDTTTTLHLFYLTTGFVLMLFLFGFKRRK